MFTVWIAIVFYAALYLGRVRIEASANQPTRRGWPLRTFEVPRAATATIVGRMMIVRGSRRRQPVWLFADNGGHFLFWLATAFWDEAVIRQLANEIGVSLVTQWTATVEQDELDCRHW